MQQGNINNHDLQLYVSKDIALSKKKKTIKRKKDKSDDFSTIRLDFLRKFKWAKSDVSFHNCGMVWKCLEALSIASYNIIAACHNQWYMRAI